MRRSALLAMTLALGCAGAAPRPHASSDPSRAALLHRLCAPLPTRAYDCVVGWPASIAPARRDAVATARRGPVWVSTPSVRAFASCDDRSGEDGPVAHVIVLLVDTSIATVEEATAELPVHVRWTEACHDETDDCASYYARADGDLLVLTRFVQRPLATDIDVAHLACSAVVDGAVEARATLESDDALVRELHVEETGLSIVSRRPGGRLGVQRERRTWTELDLAALDQQIEHDSDVRIASVGRPIHPEEVDVTDTTVLDLQIQTRTRRVRGDPSPENLHALARLAQRGFEAHPSRPDLAVVAITHAIRGRELDIATTVLAALRATVGDDDERVVDLGVSLDVVGGDASSLAARITRRAPEVPAADARRVAEALITHVSAHPVDPAVPLSVVFHAVVASARAAHTPLVHHAPTTSLPARGAAWAIVAATGGAPASTVVMCSDADIPMMIDARPNPFGTMAVLATADRCAAFVSAPGARFGLGVLAEGLAAVARGTTRMYVEVDGALVGIGGRLADRELRVDAASRAIARTDLGRIARELVLPLDALGTRTFPPPSLSIPLPEARRDAAVAAPLGIEGVTCGRAASGVSCSLESYEVVERLADAAYAIYAAGAR